MTNPIIHSYFHCDIVTLELAHDCHWRAIVIAARGLAQLSTGTRWVKAMYAHIPDDPNQLALVVGAVYVRPSRDGHDMHAAHHHTDCMAP